MHWLVPFRQAVAVAVGPSVRGPAVSALAATPLLLVVTEPLWKVMPLPLVCHATVWPLEATPLFSARACAVQVTVAPAASESIGVSEVSVGGVPPTNSVCRLEPLRSAAVTVDQVAPIAVTFIVARPSPVAGTWQEI